MIDPTSPRQLALDLASAPPPGLANFVAGRNGECVATLARLARSDAAGAPGAEAPAGERTVYLWGLPGSGKSHLARAFAEHAPARLLDASSAPAAFQFDASILRWAVDDVEALDVVRQQALFALVNAVRDAPPAALVVTGGVPPLALPVREDVRSRLGWGLIYELKPLSDDDKATALAHQARARGVTIAADVIPYLLTHASRDMRALLALLDALDRYALERKRPITLPLLREFLQPALQPGPPAATGGRTP